MLEKLKDNYIFAVIRGKTATDALEIARAAVKGGIYNLEITFSTPETASVIQTLASEYKGHESVIVGVGTVMTPELAREAIEVGSDFLVSPHYDKEIQEVAKEHGVPYLPGCATATEIVTAHRDGSPIIKLFPGGVVGPGFIKDIHGPMPEIDLMPSGGVSLENIRSWKEYGACAVGIGGALSSRVAQEGYESVTALAKEFRAALEG